MGVFRMPSLGADMETGTLVEWLIQPGDIVRRGDVVAVVETQKGAIEIESFESGPVLGLIAKVGQTVPVGEPLAQIGEPGIDVSAAEMPAAKSVTSPDQSGTISAVSDAVPRSFTGAGASPAARVAAQKAGIDLATISGSGPGGAVVLADIKTAQQTATLPTSGISGGQTQMRQAVAAAMVRSKREIPHFYVSHKIETQTVSDWLALRNVDHPPEKRVLLSAVFVKAAMLAAGAVSVVNGHFVDGQFTPADRFNAGVAIALRGGGLIAPALENVDVMTLDDVMAGMRDLVTRARSGRLRSSELTRGTLTISSLGDGGAEAMAGIIFPPQVALLTVGSPLVRPWVVDGIVQPREVTEFILSADHRVCDGRQASKFLTHLQDLLLTPEAL